MNSVSSPIQAGRCCRRARSASGVSIQCVIRELCGCRHVRDHLTSPSIQYPACARQGEGVHGACFAHKRCTHVDVVAVGRVQACGQSAWRGRTTCPVAVSYTHLDVYKRQELANAMSSCRWPAACICKIALVLGGRAIAASCRQSRVCRKRRPFR